MINRHLITVQRKVPNSPVVHGTLKENGARKPIRTKPREASSTVVGSLKSAFSAGRA